MNEQPCTLCGAPIDVGEAWMAAEESGAQLRAHSGCVYRDEDDDRRDRWTPTDETWAAPAS